MRIVVTGGSGRIGRVVVEHLAGRGHDVLNLDVVPPPRGASGKYLHTELAHRDVVEPRMADFGAEAVCHLGELANANRDLEERVYHRNAAADLGIKRIAYASSVQVYGQFGVGGWMGDEFGPLAPMSLPMDESEPPRPWNGYGAQKAGAELFLGSLCRRRGLSGAALRLPSVVATEDVRWWGRWGRGKQNKRHKLWELGAWLHTDDAATAFERAVTWPGEVAPWAQPGDAYAYEAFHLAAADVRPSGRDDVPVRDRMAEEFPHFPPLPVGWPTSACPLSTEKFRNATGWTPTVTADDLRAEMANVFGTD